MNRVIQSIPLNMIQLDQANVRFGGDEANSQREALELLMADPDDAKKILRLSEHIAINGLDPTELQMVMPAGNDTYIVLEGNRRLAALKLLQKPDICPDGKLLKSFLNAQGLLKQALPENFDFSVVPSREAGDIWVELKHTGQNNGVGRVNWDSDIRDERRARQTGVESVGRQIRIIVKDNQDVFSKETLRDISEIPVTTLTRLFSSKRAQDLFKLTIASKQLISLIPMKFIAPSVEYAIDMFATHNYNVNDIRDDDDRELFLSKIPNHITPEFLFEQEQLNAKRKSEDSKDTKSSSTENNQNSKEDGSSSESGGANESSSANETTGNKEYTSNPGDSKSSSARARPSTRMRKYLLPWSLSIANTRINEIYRELRKDIEVDKCPNATAIAFRVFIEVTCDDYILKYATNDRPVVRLDNAKKVVESDSLEVKVKSVVGHLEALDLLTKQQSKTIIKRASAHDKVGSVDHFNQFVHSAATPPIPSELKDIADEYRPLLEAIWK